MKGCRCKRETRDKMIQRNLRNNKRAIDSRGRHCENDNFERETSVTGDQNRLKNDRRIFYNKGQNRKKK